MGDAAAGLRFECQGCGACCLNRVPGAYVALTADDQRRLAAHFGLTVEAFVARWGRVVGGKTLLQEANDGCVLLESGRCRAYAARPLQCRTWPFWPEHLAPGAFQERVASFCPGAGRGPEWDPERVRAIAQEQEKADQGG